MAPRRRVGRKWRWVSAGVVVALAGLIAGFIYTRPHPSPPHPPSAVTVPQSIRNQISFPIYVPTNLPSGFSVDTASFRIPDKNVLIFDLNVFGQRVAVSEQLKPTSTTFDIESFYKNNVSNLDEFLTGQGQAAIGQLSDGRQFGSLTVTTTWIIVTAPSSVIPDRVSTILKDMQPLSP